MSLKIFELQFLGFSKIQVYLKRKSKSAEHKIIFQNWSLCWTQNSKAIEGRFKVFLVRKKEGEGIKNKHEDIVLIKQ